MRKRAGGAPEVTLPGLLAKETLAGRPAPDLCRQGLHAYGRESSGVRPKPGQALETNGAGIPVHWPVGKLRPKGFKDRPSWDSSPRGNPSPAPHR